MFALAAWDDTRGREARRCLEALLCQMSKVIWSGKQRAVQSSISCLRSNELHYIHTICWKRGRDRESISSFLFFLPFKKILVAYLPRFSSPYTPSSSQPHQSTLFFIKNNIYIYTHISFIDYVYLNSPHLYRHIYFIKPFYKIMVRSLRFSYSIVNFTTLRPL